MIEREMTVIAIHGEGDRAAIVLRSVSDAEAKELLASPDALDGRLQAVAPEVTVVLADAEGHRLELKLRSWGEVEVMKGLAGFDMSPDRNGKPKRHWQHGAKIKVTIG